jgi:hypothetical protein
VSSHTDDQLEFIHELEELAGYDGKTADDDFRTLIADVQDEFANLKRGAAREGWEKDERLTVGDVLALGAEVGKDFPKAKKGCDVFVSVWATEQADNAENN